MRITMFILVLMFSNGTHAAVTAFINRSQWMQSVPSYDTIDFTGFPNFTLITDQYSSQGVHFTDGVDLIDYTSAYLNDGVGLSGGIPSNITIEFDSMQYWFAADFPGFQLYELSYQGVPFYTTGSLGGGGTGFFAGFISTQPFDKVRIFDVSLGLALVDDIYFGPPIPAPGALPLLGVTALAFRTRRRR